MPNWCITEYAFYGEEKNALRLLDDIKSLPTRIKDTNNDVFSYIGNPYWLGYIRSELLSEVNENIYMRGEISYIDDCLCLLENGMAAVKFSTETAWCACTELMYFLANKYSLQVYYYSEEPGMGIVETNDENCMFFAFRYMIDSDSEGIEYYNDFDEVADTIEEITGIRISDMSEIKEKLSSFNNEEKFLFVNQISVV